MYFFVDFLSADFWQKLWRVSQKICHSKPTLNCRSRELMYKIFVCLDFVWITTMARSYTIFLFGCLRCPVSVALINVQFIQTVVSLYWVYCWTIIQRVWILVVENFDIKIRYTYKHFLLVNSHKPLYRCIECIVGRLYNVYVCMLFKIFI